MTKSPTKIRLSVIILNYNSGEYLKNCLASLTQSIYKHYEVIVVDNASTDNSLELAKKATIHNVKFITLDHNLGFSAGNNSGGKLSNPDAQYILFLNPDTIVNPKTLGQMINFLDATPLASAATCKVILAKTNQIQPECHRGFPTPWRSFCYFSGLSKIFPRSKLFSGYFLGHLDLNTVHPIEACVGAFIIIRKRVGDQLNWWSEKYFMYGEDLDFCYRLKQHNFQLFYYPHTFITHFQGISSGIKKTQSAATRETRLRSALATTQAMKVFYQDHYLNNTNIVTRSLIIIAINLLEFSRTFKAKYL